MQPITPYTGQTPDDIAYQRKMAMQLMGQGTDTSPVGHWTQALARVAQGGVGGMYQANARQGEQDANQEIARALQGVSEGKANIGNLAANPWTRQLGEGLAREKFSWTSPQAQAQAAAASRAADLHPLQKQMLQKQIDAAKMGTVPDGSSLYVQDPKAEGGIRFITPPEGATGGKRSLQPVWGSDASGKPVLMQLGPRGDAVATKLPDGVTPNAGIQKVDLGTHWGIIDAKSGNVSATIPKDNTGAAAQKEMGKAQGKVAFDLPKIVDSGDQALALIAKMRTHPGRAYATGALGALPGIPGTQQRDFIAMLDQAKGKVFLEAYNSLRGSGQISNAEGGKAEQAFARLDRGQSSKAIDEAFNDLETVIRSGVARARQQAGGMSAPAAAPANGDWSIQKVE